MPLFRSTRKGVSPLIAAVLLIAFTMAVAAILTAWATTFTQDRSEQLSNQSEQLIGCSYAGIDVYDAEYDSANNQVSVSVENTGTVDFNNISLASFTGATIQSKAYVANLEVGAAKSKTLSDVNEKPDKIRAASRDCPGVVSEETTIRTS